MMPKFLSWPIRVHLLILVILLALPSITLIIFWGVDARDQAIVEAKSECLKFVNAIAGEQRAAVAGVQQLVAALALLPQVQSRNGPATDALLSDLLKKNALYSNIVISDPSGLLWASSTPYEGKISVAGRKYFRDAVRSGTFSSGEFSVGRIAKTPVMTFAQPVTNTSNKLSDVIAVALNLGYVQALFEKIHLPAGSSFSLLDHRGVILHRNSQDAFSEQLVGKRDVREDLFTRMVEGPDEGTYEAIGNDDKERLVAYRKIRLPHESQPYLYIRSSIPRATVVSQANAVMFRNMAALASVFAVGLILALFIGKRMIVGPIMKLKEASMQLSAGPGLVNVSEQVKHGELGELAHAFDDMAEALHRKEKEQLAAEEELRQAHARVKWLARLPEENPNPVLRVSVDGNSRYCNPAAMELDGWKCEGGQPIPGPVLLLVRKAMAEDREVLQDVDLGERTYSVAVTSFPEEGYANVYGRDITERKLMEAELRKANDELEERVKERTYELYAESLYARSLIEASLDPLVTISVDGKITDVNHASEEATGVPRAQLIGSDFSDYFTEPEKARAGYEEVFRQGFVRDYPLELKRRDGHVTPVLYNATLYRDEKGRVMGVFAAARDITERKHAEKTVKAERQRLYDVLEALPVYAILLTPDHHVPFANRFFRERFGESHGKRCYEYLFERIEPCETCETYTVQKTGKRHHWEWIGPDGRNYDIFDYPFTDFDGSPLIMEVGIDITERKRAEAALRKLASELVMAEERERKRIAGVLHDEVAQTLAAAKMRIDMLKGTPSDQEQTLKEAKALLVQSIQETRALMTDIGNPLLFDMGLKTACESLADRLMERHPVRIICDIRDAFKYVNPDVKTILYQLIRELLNNVVKHSQAQNAHVLLDMENGYFQVKVTDDGVGFDPRTLGVPTIEGGFGLYSIRERLIAIDGSLRIESAPGTGTIVTAILPEALD